MNNLKQNLNKSLNSTMPVSQNQKLDIYFGLKRLNESEINSLAQFVKTTAERINQRQKAKFNGFLEDKDNFLP